MWARKLKKGLDFAETARHSRRGMRLAVLLGIMATIPGLVAGTTFITAPSAVTLTATSSVVSSVWCGFSDPVAGEQTTGGNYVGTPTLSNQIGTGVGANGGIYATVSFTFTTVTVGSTGYEYLDGVFDIGCSGTPATGVHTISLAASDAGTAMTLSGFTSAVMFVEKAAISSTQPDYAYCAPGSNTATAADQAFASGTCTGTIVNPACLSTDTSLFLPNDGDVTAGNWAGYKLGTAATLSCGATAAMTTLAITNSVSTGAISWDGTVSFALYGVTNAATASGTFVFTLAQS